MNAEFGNKIVQSQPFSVFLGVTCAFWSEEKVELHLPVTSHLHQQNGFVHGGVIGYLADNALGFAAGAKANKPVLTSEFKINYLRPAIGETLIARGEVLHAGKTQHVVQAKVFVVKDNIEKLCAIAQGTIIIASNL